MSDIVHAAPAKLLVLPRGTLVPLGLVAIWAVTVDGGLVHHPLLVPLARVLAAPLAGEGREIWPALAASLGRVLTGFLLGGTLGLATGALVGLSRPARETLSPSVHTLRQITLFAWIPLLTAWFGNGEAPKLVFVALSAFFPVFLATETGFRGVPRGMREVAAVLRLSPRRRLVMLDLPAAAPAIASGLQIGLLTAWIGTVGAEYAIGSGLGLGAFLAAARDHFRMDLVLAGVLALAFVGWALGALLTRLLQVATPWNRAQ